MEGAVVGEIGDPSNRNSRTRTNKMCSGSSARQERNNGISKLSRGDAGVLLKVLLIIKALRGGM
jgi:hypothetical protein